MRTKEHPRDTIAVWGFERFLVSEEEPTFIKARGGVNGEEAGVPMGNCTCARVKQEMLPVSTIRTSTTRGGWTHDQPANSMCPGKPFNWIFGSQAGPSSPLVMEEVKESEVSERVDGGGWIGLVLHDKSVRGGKVRDEGR